MMQFLSVLLCAILLNSVQSRVSFGTTVEVVFSIVFSYFLSAACVAVLIAVWINQNV